MAEILFSFDVCVCVGVRVFLCVCLSVFAQRNSQLDQFTTVKATGFNYDMHVPRNSPLKYLEKGRDHKVA